MSAKKKQPEKNTHPGKDAENTAPAQEEQSNLQKETLPEDKDRAEAPASAEKKQPQDASGTAAPDTTAPKAEDDLPDEGVEEAESLTHKSGNTFLRKLMDSNFIEYASYVIKERAIPDVDDGLKPVQRRILWALYKLDDGKFHKVANVIGDTMKYHPHGDASIGDALVVLANKEYYIDKQGNFGNILTGDVASAARYIECRLTPLAREVLFNNDITEFIDSYDGRNKEPVTLPIKIPSLLMLGAEGIAVGMATKVLPHNFRELLEAQIAILRKQKIEIYPDFLQGGIMDVSEYEDGNGKITLRAKIDREGRRLIIREIPATTTTESLIASIEKAVARNKMKLASIHDYTTDKVEIEITPMRGYDPEKCLKALYAYTDCSVSISANMTLICDNKPRLMTVTEVLQRNTEKLRDYLRRELEIELGKLEDKFHEKTLAQIFIENRIYKRIEECKTYELVLSEVHAGLQKFRKMLKRDITDEDVEKLLAIPIRRISLFDINKNRKDIDDILRQIDEVNKNLANLTRYAVKYLKNLVEKYAKDHERRTEIEEFDRVDKRAVALNNIKVGWDRKGCYIGTSVKSDERVTCNEYDHLLCIERKGTYKVINIPDKIFVGRLYYFTKYDKNQEYYIVYSEKKTGKFYAKRTVISKFITDKEYSLCPAGCKLEIITTRPNSLYEFEIDTKFKDKKKLQFNLSDAAERTPKARGQLISPKKILGYKFIEIIEETEPDTLFDENGNPLPSPEQQENQQPADELIPPSDSEHAENTDTEKNKNQKKTALAQAVKKEDKKHGTDKNNKDTLTEKQPADHAKKTPDDTKSHKDKKTSKKAADKKQNQKKDGNKKTVKSEEIPENNIDNQKQTKPPKKKNTNPDVDSLDDLGISQPEFGF